MYIVDKFRQVQRGAVPRWQNVITHRAKGFGMGNLYVQT